MERVCVVVSNCYILNFLVMTIGIGMYRNFLLLYICLEFH